MAITYLETNNILASIYYFVSAQMLADGLSWSIIYGFKKAYDETLPVIAIRSKLKSPGIGEIGSKLTTKDHAVYIDIFAIDGDEKNNMKDYLASILIDGCDYNTYVIDDDGVPVATTTSDKVEILSITEEDINLNTDKSQLDIHDRYRFRLNLVASIGRMS